MANRKYNGEGLPDMDFSQKGTGSTIQAMVRPRPLLEKELSKNLHESVSIASDTTLILAEPYDGEGHPGGAKAKKLQFEYSRVFSKTASNQEVYEWSTRPLIPGLLEGINATIFAYGAAGSGKTHTISGNGETPGILSYALNDLVNSMDSGDMGTSPNPTPAKSPLSSGLSVMLKMSYVEIYNENLRDLLVTDDKPLDIREDPIKGIILHGVSEVPTTQKKEVLKMIRIGNRNKTEDLKRDNSGGGSAKSHLILLLQIEAVDTSSGGKPKVTQSKFFLADLAGTEKTLGVRGKKVKEGGIVNRSLLALGNCITVLSEGKVGAFVPYRDSKLTRLLKDSLGGNSRTVMLATITTAARDFEETLNTLKYAIRAKSIRNYAIKNVSEDVGGEMKSIIESLKKENESLKKLLNENKTPMMAKKIPEMAQPSSNSSSAILQEIQKKILEHFHAEKKLRMHRAEIEEGILSIQDELNQGLNSQTAQNEQKMYTLTNEKTKVNEEIAVMVRNRTKLTETVNDSGLGNVQMTFLSNVIYKEQLEADLIDSSPIQKKTEKAVNMNDWNIEFLKDQILKRDKIMVSQLERLEQNQILPPLPFEGLRKIENLPKDIHRASDDLYLPPLVSDRFRSMEMRVASASSKDSHPSLQLRCGGCQDSGVSNNSGLKKFGVRFADEVSSPSLYRPILPKLGPSYSNYSPTVKKTFAATRLTEARNMYYKNYGSNGSSQPLLGLRKESASSKGSRAGSALKKPIAMSSIRPSGYLANRYQYRNTAIPQARAPASVLARYGSGNLYSKESYSKYARSPVERINSGKSGGNFTQTGSGDAANYTPITRDDYTLEALQQKREALLKLNERLKNM